MEEVLRNNSQVKIETDCLVSSIRVDEKGRQGLLVKTGANGGTERHFTHVISTVPSRALGDILYSESDHTDEASCKINRYTEV